MWSLLEFVFGGKKLPNLDLDAEWFNIYICVIKKKECDIAAINYIPSRSYLVDENYSDRVRPFGDLSLGNDREASWLIKLTLGVLDISNVAFESDEICAFKR